MKALTLHQPWASLIAHGFKRIETRSWHPSPDLVGQRIAIHAAKKPVDLRLLNDETMDKTFVMMERDGGDLPFGMVVATARYMHAARVLEPCSDKPGKVWARDLQGYIHEIDEDPYGDFSAGRWLWILDDVVKHTIYTPATGRQGLWEWNRGQAAAIR